MTDAVKIMETNFRRVFGSDVPPPLMAYDLLEGIKVVELSMYAFAPVSAAVLGDWGAEVIKVVPP